VQKSYIGSMLSIDPIVSKLFIDLYSLVMAFSRCSVNEREAGLVKKNFAAGRSTLPGQKERKKKKRAAKQSVKIIRL